MTRRASPRTAALAIHQRRDSLGRYFMALVYQHREPQKILLAADRYQVAVFVGSDWMALDQPLTGGDHGRVVDQALAAMLLCDRQTYLGLVDGLDELRGAAAFLEAERLLLALLERLRGLGEQLVLIERP